MTSGIATIYRETRFRSRLEARWATFFDLIGWQWVYEPFDAGRWIPDFLIQGKRPLLVEVGPCVTIDQYYAKAAKPLTYRELPTLMLGVTPALKVEHELYGSGIYLGLLTSDGADSAPGAARIGRCEECHAICAMHDWGVYTHFPCGHWSDRDITPLPDVALQETWARAGNEVQWRKAG